MDDSGFGGWSDIGVEDYDQPHKRLEDGKWSLRSWWQERRKPKQGNDSEEE